MARYHTLNFTTASIAAGTWLAINQPIPLANEINLLKLKVVPNEAGGSSRFQIHKRDTFLDMDKLYDTKDFTGSLIDPVEDYSDPMTDTPGATAERNEGSPIPYEDLDATNELHMRIWNGDADAKSYTITVWYEVPIFMNANNRVVVGGDTTVNGWIDITRAPPSIYMTDTTPGKGLRMTLGGDMLNITEKTAGNGTFWVYDLVNFRAGLGATPISRLANTNAFIQGSHGGYGPSPDGLVWINFQAGWTMQVVPDTSVANCRGLLVKGLGNSVLPVMMAESNDYSNTFLVTSDGRVGIGPNTPGSAVFHVRGDQRPIDPTLLVERTISGGTVSIFSNADYNDSTVIHSASYSPNYGYNIALYYVGTLAIGFVTSFKATYINLANRDYGSGADGGYILVGNNNNASNSVAGHINYINRNGVGAAVWQDAAGQLRIGNNTPGALGDTGGVVVGNQTSAPSGKQDMRPVTPDERTAVVQRLFNAPLFTYEVVAEAEAGIAGHRHLGFMNDQVPQWMWHDGNTIDQHRVGMEILVGLQELADFVGYTPAPGPPARGGQDGRG